MSEPIGQILLGTQFGEMLKSLAKQSNHIVEVGTHWGLGSTKCLHAGMVRPTQILWTIDPWKPYHDEAKKHFNDQRVRFITRKTLDPLTLDELPPEIDLLLLDGDDMATELEFEALEPRCVKFVALDDTKELKNRAQRWMILNRPDLWVVIADVQNERNGWMIAQKIKP